MVTSKIELFETKAILTLCVSVWKEVALFYGMTFLSDATDV